MNIRIYQVNMSRDVNNVGFASYENLEKWQGTSAIDSTIYDKVFEGDVDCKSLEDVYVSSIEIIHQTIKHVHFPSPIL